MNGGVSEHIGWIWDERGMGALVYFLFTALAVFGHMLDWSDGGHSKDLHKQGNRSVMARTFLFLFPINRE